MNTAPTSTASSGGFAGKMRQAEAWLDRKGKFAWIVAMILGFVFFWPLGLALLAYMIWSNRMFTRSSCTNRHARRGWDHPHARMYGSSGNTAFDTYKADALSRLEEEQVAFEAFIQRLRDAKDKAQFDSFMEDRARATREADVTVDVKVDPATDGRGGAY